ncbi:MAG: LuxR C-terminal-related transcriptional regulator [Clostridiales bacterium]|nr:LuxR C-terminal-related transcriptional regulator [Clostridiales bacterium]
MDYMSVGDAAKNWKISERYVQRYCAEGRIEGAVKIGRSWAIPADARKPVNVRWAARKNDSQEGLRDEEENSAQPRKLFTAMPLLNTPYQPGTAGDSIAAIEDADTRNIALAEFYYFSGRSAEASDLAEEYLSHRDIAIRLSACWLYGYANLALDRIPRARQALAQVRSTLDSVDETTPEIYRAYALCIATGACVLLHLPVSERLGSIREYLPLLPPGLRLFALYVQAHRTYLDGQYGTCIGIAETALALEGTLYPIPTIYLHLVATMGYINLRQNEQAKAHLTEAWKIARPDDMIEPFGEHHGLLGGMLETTLKKDYPDDFKRIIDITYSFSAGWRKIHNPDTGHHVADDLSTTEFTVAMLAARGWSNKEISAHLGISTNTVKMHISSVLQELNVPQRGDLAKYMLK